MRLPALFHHRAYPGAKLTVDEVRWIRNWARMQPRPRTISDLVRRLKARPEFAMLGAGTLREVLDYSSWVKVKVNT